MPESLGVCPEVDTAFDGGLASVLGRYVGALEDESFDELDMWDLEITRFRDQITSHTGEMF